MGLFLKMEYPHDSREKSMIYLFSSVLDQLKKRFNFVPLSKFKLWLEDTDEDLILTNKKFSIKTFISRARGKSEDLKEKKDLTAHFSISVEGRIELMEEGGSETLMMIDIVGTTVLDLKDINGNLRVNFFNTKNRKWQEYFVGKSNYAQTNRSNLKLVIEDILKPDFHIYSIFFADSNIVFKNLKTAYFIYFGKYKFFLEYLLILIEKRIDINSLEYDNILITPKKRPKLLDLKKDLSLLKTDEFVKILDRGTIPFLNKYKDFVSDQYEKNIEFSAASSIKISDVSMNKKRIRDAFTDFLGNFIDSLYKAIPKYKKIEDRVKTEFKDHKFEPEKKSKQKRL